MQSQPFFRAHRWTLPSRGNFEVKVTRTSKNEDPSRNTDKCVLFAIQSFRPEYPINFRKPVTLTAKRIKSSNQLNGTLDTVSGIAQSILPDWNGSAWVPGITQNPASIALNALMGNGAVDPAGPDEIDWPSFQDWHAFCALKGLKYNRVHDFEGTRGEGLKAVGAAGRAVIKFNGTKWTVIIDRPRSLVVDHINPRNSSQFRWRPTYPKVPHAVRVPFLDETNDYQQAERLIPWPPETVYATKAAMEANMDYPAKKRVQVYGDPVTINDGYYEKVGPRGSGYWQLASMDVTEEWQFPGNTNPDSIYREARRRMYEVMYRNVAYSAVQDGAARVATAGDKLMASRDVLVTAMHSGRVKAVRGKRITTDETFTMDEGGSYGIRFRKFTEEDTVGVSIVRQVKTAPGETKSLTVEDDEESEWVGEMPEPGDLIQFGPLGSDSIPVILTGVERGQDNSSVLHMVAAAETIDTKTDAEVIPAWSGRVGDEVSTINTPPAVPVVTGVVSGYAGNDGPNGLRIALRPGGGPVIVNTFEVRYRKSGETTWQGPKSDAAGAGSVEITGYVRGDSVEMQPRAVSIYGIPSGWGATVTHTIGQADPGQAVAVSVSTVGTFNLGGVLFAIEGDPEDDNLRRVAIHRRAGGAVWNPSSVPVKTIDLVAGASKKVRNGSKRTALNPDPDFNNAGLNTITGGDWSVVAGQAVKVAGTVAAQITQAYPSGSKPSVGDVLRIACLIAETNGSTTLNAIHRTTPGSGGQSTSPSMNAAGLYTFSLTITAVQDNLGLTASAVRSAKVEALAGFVQQAGDLAQGQYTYRFVSLNADGQAGGWTELTITIA